MKYEHILLIKFILKKKFEAEELKNLTKISGNEIKFRAINYYLQKKIINS